MEERLQKVLSRAGFGSRRECEEFIEAQRVTVNGELAVLGTKTDPEKDQIRVDGILLNYQEPEKVYIAVNKPRFVLCDRVENDARQTVYGLVPNSESLFVVGRLDFESEGLVLMTNDGDLANKLTHPRFEQEKEYKVLVAKRPDDRQLEAWKRGVVLENGERTAPAKVAVIRQQGEGAWLRVTLREGRKREIREICRTIGLPVVKLIRVRIGTLQLGQLQSREWAYLKTSEVRELKDLAAGKSVPLPKAGGSVSRPAARRSNFGASSSAEKPFRSEGKSFRSNGRPDRPAQKPYRPEGKPYGQGERSERKSFELNDRPWREDDRGNSRRDSFNDREERGSFGSGRRNEQGENPMRRFGENRPERKPYRTEGKPYHQGERSARKPGWSEERSEGKPVQAQEKPYRLGERPDRKSNPSQGKPYRSGERPDRKSNPSQGMFNRSAERSDRKPFERSDRPCWGGESRSKRNFDGGRKERTGGEDRPFSGNRGGYNRDKGNNRNRGNR